MGMANSCVMKWKQGDWLLADLIKPMTYFVLGLANFEIYQ